MQNEAKFDRIEARIEQFIAIFGVLFSAIAAGKWGWRAAASAGLGASLCWLNFRWLRHGATGVIRLGMAQAGVEHVHVPRSMHAKFFGRLLLLLVAVYGILAWLKLPAVALLCGLGAVVPAILVELAWEVAAGEHRFTE